MSNKKGSVIILSAPAGTGKTTLMRKLLQEFPNVIQSISYTTREPRSGEIPGKDYHFVSLHDFKRMVDEGEFLEHVKLYGHYYGTPKKWIEDRQKEGKHVVLVIDTQGGLQLKAKKYKAVYIFVSPPSMEELKRRLMGRSTETSSVIDERLACADREIEQGKQYDHHIVNDNLEVAYSQLRNILIAEEARRNQ